MTARSGRRVDYDAIADTYERRYLTNDYSGVEHAVIAFAGQPDLRVVEVGCGTGHWLRVLERAGIHATGGDVSIEMLARAHAAAPRVPIVQGTAEQLPWTNAAFDRVFCVNALHHFQDTPAFLSEARRVLRSGGRLMSVGLDPHTGLDRWYLYEYFEPVLEIDRRRYPAATGLREWMRLAGFVDCVTRQVQHVPVRLPARTAIEQGRLERSATSQLSLLTDAQYQQGLERIRRAIDAADVRGEILYVTADLRLYATVGAVPAA
jgi:ubiquinone/menaquinone biosynthesis C-methylase UbiE